MLNKDQALAVMDAHILRVEAEQRRRLEKRTGRLGIIHPALRRVPLEDRIALLRKAQAHALRHWTLYASLALVIASIIYALRAQIFGVQAEVKSSTLFSLFPLLPIPGLVHYLNIRSYLKNAVATRYR